jgi:hypothetical protein
MKNLARQESQTPIYQEQARVVDVQERRCRLEAASGTYNARQAISCLVTPCVGDHVLAAVDSHGNAYVLAILEREQAAVNQIDFDGEVQLRVRRGRLAITSQEGMDLASAGRIRAISEDLEVQAVTGAVHLQDGMLQAGRLNTRIGAIHWLAETVDGIAERITQRVKRVYRNVEEFEQVKAGRMDYLVRKLLSFRSRYTVLTAKEDVKVDGERIHIG